MRICVLEPYYTGSHAAWVNGYATHSQHEILPLTLTGQFWKWRMHGGAVTMARMCRERCLQADLLLASDMLDFCTFLALTRDMTHHTPTALYMHENQLTYPLRPGDRRDLHYGFINYASMLCAERVYFNSDYHLASWFDELPRLLKHFPDYNELPTVSLLRERSQVLPLGLDLGKLDPYHPVTARLGKPLILWNHRWEYDKNPGEFLQALYTLAERGLDFQVALLGEAFVRVPPEFEEARQRLNDRIAQFGYVDSYADYAQWLWQADIVVSTALHDFFGAAVVEAMYCGCFPILPRRLAYPQFVPECYQDRCLYRDHDELVALLTQAILQIGETRATSLRQDVARYDWTIMAPEYDRRLSTLMHGT